MNCIKLIRVLQNHRYFYFKGPSKAMETSMCSRQFSTEFTPQRTMKLAHDLYSPPGFRKEDLPPVILLHSMLDSRKTWKFIAPEIAKRTGREVYAVDARNHGESPYSDEITFDLLTEDLEEFLRQQSIHKAILVGHSMGGRTSITLALKKPEKVEKLVVEDMHTKNFRPTQDGPIMETLKVIRDSVPYIPADADESELRKVFIQIMTPLLLGDRSKLFLVNNNFDISMLPFRKDNGSFSYKANLDAVKNFITSNNICQNLHGVFLGDSLFINGTKSFFRVDTDPQILEHFPEGKIVAIEGGSHFIHFEDPKRFVDEVTNFININNNVKKKY